MKSEERTAAINWLLYEPDGQYVRAVVQQAMDDWRRQYDAASDAGFTMAEFVVIRLHQHGKLS